MDFRSCSDKSSVPGVNRNDLHRIPVLLPPLAEQKAIAAVLGALDDKIELNRRMNATLEAMAMALTIDFKRTPEVVFVNTGDVLEGDFLHSKRSVHTGLPGQAKKSIQPEDILFSEIRPANKRYAYVDFDSRDYVVSTKFMIIRGSTAIHPRLLYRILTMKETLDEFQLQAESRSGTFPQITFDSISHLPIVLPPIVIQEAFQRAVGYLDAQIKVNKQQSRTLATLRDTLLPKLLSGELSVVGQPLSRT